jgi:hypothetical protein
MAQVPGEASFSKRLLQGNWHMDRDRRHVGLGYSAHRQGHANEKRERRGAGAEDSQVDAFHVPCPLVETEAFLLD